MAPFGAVPLPALRPAVPAAAPASPAAGPGTAPPGGAPGAPGGHGSYHDAVSAFKRRLIEATLLGAGGNRSHAARALGLQRTYLLRLMREFRVDVPRAAGSPASALAGAGPPRRDGTRRAARGHGSLGRPGGGPVGRNGRAAVDRAGGAV
jgi:hypothetical protein